jgi:hypothetical protein
MPHERQASCAAIVRASRAGEHDDHDGSKHGIEVRCDYFSDHQAPLS